MQTVAVDFDGVVHDYKLGWQDGTIYGDLMPGASEALRVLMGKYAVFIHSTRKPRPVARWIKDKTGIDCVLKHGEFWNDQGFLLVTNVKLPAVAYIDDRALKFEDWDQVLAELG